MFRLIGTVALPMLQPTSSGTASDSWHPVVLKLVQVSFTCRALRSATCGTSRPMVLGVFVVARQPAVVSATRRWFEMIGGEARTVKVRLGRRRASMAVTYAFLDLVQTLALDSSMFGYPSRTLSDPVQLRVSDMQLWRSTAQPLSCPLGMRAATLVDVTVPVMLLNVLDDPLAFELRRNRYVG